MYQLYCKMEEDSLCQLFSVIYIPFWETYAWLTLQDF